MGGGKGLSEVRAGPALGVSQVLDFYAYVWHT
jgi:hypothetical protein